jgi:hypothetical protein
MFDLQPPRHIPTLPKTEVVLFEPHVRSTADNKNRPGLKVIGGCALRLILKAQ